MGIQTTSPDERFNDNEIQNILIIPYEKCFNDLLPISTLSRSFFPHLFFLCFWEKH